MSEIFDNRVEYAIQNIWVNPRSGNGKQAFQGLQEAAQENNGDACYFLARCYSGPCYVDPGHGFESDDDKAEEWYNKSIELGSAVGMMGAMRVGASNPAAVPSYMSPTLPRERSGIRWWRWLEGVRFSANTWWLTLIIMGMQWNWQA